MKTYLACLILIGVTCLSIVPVAARLQPAPSYDALKSQAEQFFEQGSYSKSHDLYTQAATLTLNDAAKRWVAFRLADTQWRAQAASNTHDSTIFDSAREQLETIIREVKRDEDRDLVWTETHESLGDFWWARRDSQNWGGGWQHYQHALDYWAGQSDLETARKRYLNIVWTMTEPPWQNRHSSYWYGNVPLNILDNALKIAESKNDKARAHFHIAMSLRNQGHDLRMRLRLEKEFESALSGGKATDWYDDALFTYGQWLMSPGPVVMLEGGSWRQEPDYVKALEMFRRLTNEFRKGETQYFDQALNNIKSITNPTLNVHVSNIFLPGSEIQFHANWRNVEEIQFSLHAVDLTRDVTYKAINHDWPKWINQINLTARDPVSKWPKDTEDKGDYKPGQSVERIDKQLAPGAYILLASAGGIQTREIILVTDATIIMKTSNDKVVTFVCDALTSAPIPNAKVHIWKMWQHNNRWYVSDVEREADNQGLCSFTSTDFGSPADQRYARYFVAANRDSNQAYAESYENWYSRDHEQWKVYAFTDRPAYRPNDTVQWKLIARLRNKGEPYTPANQVISYQIADPRGTKVEESTTTLNAFGSAWGSIELSETMPLGEYRITMWEGANQNTYIGQATLFRLEEYKLPEFQVSVQTPEEDGKKQTFRLGESVSVNIQSDYYFGGPVANASVEVVVYQSPFYQYWTPDRDFPWCYEASQPWRHWGGEQVVKRESLKTDDTGRAIIEFETPANSNQDLEFRIEARVTDASRREIVGSGSVRVTRQGYYVYPRALHKLHKPDDDIEIEVKALDANQNPVAAKGNVKVTRDQWVEVWISPSGKEMAGKQLERERARYKVFPPQVNNPNDSGWRLKFRGYESEEILTTTVQLDNEGKGTLKFTAQSEGYYKIHWQSDDAGSDVPIIAETAVWVVTNASTDLAYRHGDLEIIVDKDTFRTGEEVPVMISTATNDRYVLFTVEGFDLYSYRLIHVSGNVKLIHVPIEEKHIPNVYLSASMAHNGQLHMDTEEVVVPPVDNYLDIKVTSDREQYQPGEEGTFTISTKDHDGNPVSAEVAISIADEAVAYIQQDYAGDPREYFFDQRQHVNVQTGTTFQQKSYTKLIEDENEQLIDDRLNAMREGERRDQAMRHSQIGGKGGSTFADAPMEMEMDAMASSEMSMARAPAAKSVANGRFRQEAAGMELKEDQKKVPGQEPAIEVRTDFRATIFWEPAITTDENSSAQVRVKYADSLTSWIAKARVASKGFQFGIGDVTTRTKMPLIARLQAPRFFVVGDTVTISGVLNNNTDEAMNVFPQLDAHAEGLRFLGVLVNGESFPADSYGSIDIAANSESRIDWQVAVENAGPIQLTLTATSDSYSDAMEKTYIAYEHGVERFLAKSGKVRGKDVTITLDIPSERKPETTVLAVQVSPSMAVTMLDALPYLIDYSYGCTEQTMSRFLPAAITAKTLSDLGIDAEIAMSKVFGGIEEEHAAKTHPKGKKNLAKLDHMVQAGLDRLYSFQHSDGGWGWWKEGNSDHFMTAYVLWGLSVARDAGLDVDHGAMQRAVRYLDREIVEEERNYDIQSWMLHALSAYHQSFKRREIGEFQQKAFDNLWNSRDRLNAYTRALLALSAHQFGDQQRAQILVDNLENGVKKDDRPDVSVIVKGAQGPNESVIGTAHWGEDGIWWRWSEGGVEATAFALRAILAIDPENELIEPVTNWMVKNRRGAQWSNTRDTAITVLALNDYLRTSGELTPDIEYEVTVNGHEIASQRLSAADALSAPSRFEINRERIQNGKNEIRIRRKRGDSPIYFSAEASFFSLEEPVPPSGNEIFVRRDYYKLVPRPTLLKGYVYDRIPLEDGGHVTSGERVEVVMTIEAKNNYEYLVFEDLKPAGLEAVAIRSGESMYAKEMKSGAVDRTFGEGHKTREAIMTEQAHGDHADYTGRTRWVYQELRDRKVAMFIDKLPEGVWELRYDLRAEVPGRFHALPVMAHAMYVPEIRANSAELRISVLDSE